MKKIVIFLCSLFLLRGYVLADGIEMPVNFTLIDGSYNTIERSYQSGRFMFLYTNDLLNNEDSLNTILAQVPGENESPLVYYETLNIKVNPLIGTPYAVLKDKPLYMSNTSNWTINSTETTEMPDSAKKVDLDNNMRVFGFNIAYRTSIDGEFSNVIPGGLDLSNKSLEEQLALLLDIDLESDPTGVIDSHKILWTFDPLNTGYLTYRFDFFTENENTELVTGKTDEYLTSTLQKLGTEYVVIKYERNEESSVFKLTNNEKKAEYLPYIFGTVTSLGVGLYFYLKRASI